MDEWVVLKDDREPPKVLESSSSEEDNTDEEKANKILEQPMIEKAFVMVSKPAKRILIKKITLGIGYVFWKNKMQVFNYMLKTLPIDWRIYIVIIVIASVVFLNQLRQIIANI